MKLVPGMRKGGYTADLNHGIATFQIDKNRSVEMIVEGLELTFITMKKGKYDGVSGPLPQRIFSSFEMTGPGKKQAVWIAELTKFTK